MSGNSRIFEGPLWPLQLAIEWGDVVRATAELESGIDPNERGRNGTTPIAFAVGKLQGPIVALLLDAGADPALRDDRGQNAVTLAAMAYRKDPTLLEMLIKAGADPNTKRPDGDPIITRFVNDRDLAAIRFMAKNGADLNIRGRNGSPIIVNAATAQDWDVVWTLLDLGAGFEYGDENFSLESALGDSGAVPSDSPLWPFKEQVWHFLHGRGAHVPPLQ